jgi:hypothetical protein
LKDAETRAFAADLALATAFAAVDHESSSADLARRLIPASTA